MHPKSNHQSEYLKLERTGHKYGNPITKRMGGYDAEDLAARAGIEYYRIKKICNENLIPNPSELQLIALALESSFVDLVNEYKEFKPPKSN